jgi:hypothetical protein
MVHAAVVDDLERATLQTNDDDDDAVHAGYVLWHVYDAGGPMLSLKVRCRDDEEVHDWQDGPNLFDALEQAAAEGRRAFDREPDNAPGEYVIYHLVRATGSPVSA